MMFLNVMLFKQKMLYKCRVYNATYQMVVLFMVVVRKAFKQINVLCAIFLTLVFMV